MLLMRRAGFVVSRERASGHSPQDKVTPPLSVRFPARILVLPYESMNTLSCISGDVVYLALIHVRVLNTVVIIFGPI